MHLGLNFEALLDHARWLDLEGDVQVSDGVEVHPVPEFRVFGDVLPRPTHTGTPAQTLDANHAQDLCGRSSQVLTLSTVYVSIYTVYIEQEA